LGDVGKKKGEEGVTSRDRRTHARTEVAAAEWEVEEASEGPLGAVFDELVGGEGREAVAGGALGIEGSAGALHGDEMLRECCVVDRSMGE
jgi:hypothetical protein